MRLRRLILLLIAASADAACPSGFCSVTGDFLLQKGSSKKRTALLADAPGTLLAHWTFEVPEDSRSIPDVSGNGRELSCQRHRSKRKSEEFFAKAAPAEGLGRSSGLVFPDRSSASAEVSPFRTFSLWLKRSAGCCTRIKDLVFAKRPGGGKYMRIDVNKEKLRVNVWSLGKGYKVQAALPKATEAKYIHVAVTIATGKATLYLDGKPVAATKDRKKRRFGFSDEDVGSAALSLKLGTGGKRHQFQGAMDEVRVYAEALSESDIRALADDSSEPAPTPSPVTVTPAPVPVPTDPPTEAPTMAPTQPPSAAPTPTPTAPPTPAPTLAPTPAPTAAPTPAPTASPTPAPTRAPTPAPTPAPTQEPTPAPTPPTPPPPALPATVGHWRFDEGLGKRFLKDDSGNGAELTVTQQTQQHPFAELRPGEGLGGGGGIRFYSRSGATTVVKPFRGTSLWIKRDVGCCNRMNPFLEAHRKGDASPFLQIYTVHDRLYVNLKNAVGTGVNMYHPNPPATEEAWQHIAVAIGDDKLTLYVDGAEVVSRTADLSDMGAGSLDFRIGVHTHHPFLGIMDEVRLFQDALTEEAILALGSAATSAGGGLMPGEQVLRAHVGPVLSVWQPATSVKVSGACKGASGAQVLWSVDSEPAPNAARFSDARSGDTTLDFVKRMPGDYILNLECIAGAQRRSEKLTVNLFPAHETKKGKTVRTTAPSPRGLEQAGNSASPVGLWLFDGNALSSAGGQSATPIEVKGTAELDFSAEGKFGGGVRINCMGNDCVQLYLGNVEDNPWPALSVSFWFKSSKLIKNTYFKKGAFVATASDYTADEWHHFVQAQDEQISKVYLDGLLISVASGVAARTYGDAADFMSFGARSGHPAYGFDGVLDELAVFDYVLSNDEVEVLNKQGASSFTARLNGNPYWRGGYSTTMLQDFFPALPEKPDYTGYFRANPKVEPPAPYVHPRIFFTPEELPALRQRLQNTDSGRVGMENLRSRLLAFPWADLDTKNFTISQVDFYLAQDFILAAFSCLIDGDSVRAQRLGQQLEAFAVEGKATIEDYISKLNSWKVQGAAFDGTDTWRIHHHNVVLRLAVALSYDFLYPFLAASTREHVRKVLAVATEGTWSIGMNAVEANMAVTSNWHPWVTGDLVLNLMAIEGEDGFDEGVWESAAMSYRGWTSLGVSSTSGATFEGGGKNALTGTKILALASHGYPQFIAAEGTIKYVREFLLNMMLPNAEWFEDELWGGIEKKPLAGDVMALKVAFPDDAVIDYVYRRAMEGGSTNNGAVFSVDLPYRALADCRPTVYTYNNLVADVIYAADYTGPSDVTEHGTAALKDQPLSWVAKDRGIMVSRSAWADEDAAWLVLNVRSQQGGHSNPSRGEFIFYALGQVWAHFPTGHNKESHLHSVILVDGKGQSVAPGKFLDYSDLPHSTWGSCDLRYPYSHAPWKETTPNYFALEKGRHKWQDLPFKVLPYWYNGMLPQGPDTGDASLGDFARAFRTVGLVRSASPFALVFDDFKKDSSSHSFAWRMPLNPTSININQQSGLTERTDMDYSSVKASGNDIVIPAVKGATRMLVRLLPGSSPATIAVVDKIYLQITAQVAEARFRVLLFPLREGEELPNTSWDAGSSTLVVEKGGSRDTFTLDVSANGLTTVQHVGAGFA